MGHIPNPLNYGGESLSRIKVSVKFSLEELQKIDSRALKTGRKRSTYIRETSLGVIPKEKPPDEFYQYMEQLGKIGNNLNQISKVANSIKFIDVKRYNEQTELLDKLLLKMLEYFEK
jgi:hypothetical protein